MKREWAMVASIAAVLAFPPAAPVGATVVNRTHDGFPASAAATNGIIAPLDRNDVSQPLPAEDGITRTQAGAARGTTFGASVGYGVHRSSLTRGGAGTDPTPARGGTAGADDTPVLAGLTEDVRKAVTNGGVDPRTEGATPDACGLVASVGWEIDGAHGLGSGFGGVTLPTGPEVEPPFPRAWPGTRTFAAGGAGLGGAGVEACGAAPAAIGSGPPASLAASVLVIAALDAIDPSLTVPEPASLALLATGLIGTAAARRRCAVRSTRAIA